MGRARSADGLVREVVHKEAALRAVSRAEQPDPKPPPPEPPSAACRPAPLTGLCRSDGAVLLAIAMHAVKGFPKRDR